MRSVVEWFFQMKYLLKVYVHDNDIQDIRIILIHLDMVILGMDIHIKYT